MPEVARSYNCGWGPSRRRSQAASLTLFSLIFGSFAGAFSQSRGTSGDANAGRIAAVMVEAKIARPSGKKFIAAPATKGSEVAWNDIVRTNTAGRARIVLNDQSILTLGSDSTLRVVKHD